MVRPTHPPAKRPAPKRVTPNHLLAGAAVFLAVVLAWGLWPSRWSSVRNLESRGSVLIAFGDSLTSGVGAAAGEDYPAVLSRRIGLAVVNAGVSGDTTDAALARVERDVLSRDPRIVIVGLGGNDFLQGTPIATTEANLHSIVRKIHGAGAMVVLLGFTFPSLGADYESMYERVARDEGCLLVPEVLENILNRPALKSDPIHPNGQGYALMAERVSEPAAELVRRADAAR